MVARAVNGDQIQGRFVIAYYITGHGFGHATRVVDVSLYLPLLFTTLPLGWDLLSDLCALRFAPLRATGMGVGARDKIGREERDVTRC